MPAPPIALVRVPRHPGALVRHRLLAVRERPAPVIVLSAPAGWGKTVLAAQLVAADDAVAAAWCRVAPGWDEATDVVAMWATSVGLPVPGGDPVEGLLELAESGPATFVVDDAHLAEAEGLDRLVSEAASLLPVGARVVVAGRTRPAGLVGRLGPLATVLDEELAFAPDEADPLASALDADPAVIHRRVEQLGGWPAGVAAAGSSTTDGEVGALLLGSVAADDRPVLVALAVLPWVDEALARTVGWSGAQGSLPVPGASAGEVAGRWMLDRSVAAAVRAHLADEEVAGVRRRAAAHLRDVDPVAAIEVLLDVGDAEAAADVLAAHLSEVGEDHAVAWLYRLPADLRHRFPPVLASGRATVAVDLAEAEAERRVAEADDVAMRREALLALGSARAAAGRLSAAAESLESAVAAGVDAPTATRARPLLALVRAWSGDAPGAMAALGDATDEQSAAARAQVALLDDDPDAAAAAATRAGSQRQALEAQVAVLAGDLDAARALAERAYADAVEAGGDRLGTAAVARAWVLVADGDLDGALAMADVLERRVGRHDAHARLEGALVRLAIGRAGGPVDAEREARRVGALREAGFAPVEALARRAMAPLGRSDGADGTGLVVELLGRGRVLVDDAPLAEDAWRSRKALEVLRVLALAGGAGSTRDALVEAVWPGREPQAARTVLRRALSDVRKELEPDRPKGEASRFVGTDADRVVLRASTDVAQVRELLSSDAEAAFDLVASGPATDLGDGEWAEELRRVVGRLRLEAAEAVAAGDGDPARRQAALERLVADEPWSREHVDALAALHRDRRDETAARAVERAWFDDDG